MNDAKQKGPYSPINHLGRNVDSILNQLNSKSVDVQHLQGLKDKSEPAAQMTDVVTAELERRNLEISSLLKSSEKSRAESDAILIEQNEELTTLRANKLILKTLEKEIAVLFQDKKQRSEKVKKLEMEKSCYKKKEESSIKKIEELEIEKAEKETRYQAEVTDKTNQLCWSQNQLIERDDAAAKTEKTLKELFDKCHQLGASNNNMKKELKHCMHVASQTKEVNNKLRFSKEFIEEQLDELLKEFRILKSKNENLKLALESLSIEKENYVDRIRVLEDDVKHYKGATSCAKEQLNIADKQIKDFESGEIKSDVVIHELRKEREMTEMAKKSVQEIQKELEVQNEVRKDEHEQFMNLEQKIKSELFRMETKLKYYEENYVEKDEMEKVKKYLEVKYKLDVNTQLQQLSNAFEKEQDEFMQSMKTSFVHRREIELDSPSSRSNSKLNNFDIF